MSEPAKPRVAVVFGGRSGEHAISCITAGSVLSVIDPERYDVIPVGISQDGKWVLERNVSRLALTEGPLPSVDTHGTAVALRAGPDSKQLVVSVPGEVTRTLGEVDVVFPLLHGPFGEDGTIQGLFEMAGVRYVGSGVLASAAGMDQHYMKLLFSAAGLPVLPYVVVKPADWERDQAGCLEAAESLGFPVFVKPARAGSSLGITKVASAGGLADAVEEARRHDPKVLVEAAASGAREIECGVLQGLNGSGPQASVVAEISVDETFEFYDFEAKYLGEEHVRLDVPADVPDGVAEEIRGLAVRAFEALGCEGLARVDFFFDPASGVVVNEINTMPGFTPRSMFPRLWAASGLDYPALVDRLLQLALQRGTGLR